MTCRDRPARRASAMSALFAAGLLLSGGAETRAQDRFGAAVAVTESGEVLAVKPAFAHGPAALFAFARSADGTWSKIAELRSEGTALRGEEMGASLSAPPWGALVASGDPGLRVAAYGFERTGDGWAEGPALPLGGSGAAPGAVSLETVMAILQPSPRVVAASEADALVAVLGGAEAGVRAYRRGPGGAWREIGRLEAEGVRGADRFGAALAVRGDRAAVGAPRHEGAGAVFLFDRSEDGWRWRSTLRPPEGVPGDGFGAALAWVGEDELVVGSPAAAGSEGRIHAFVREAEGSWHPSTLAPPVRADGQAFGAALASWGRRWPWRRDGPHSERPARTGTQDAWRSSNGRRRGGRRRRGCGPCSSFPPSPGSRSSARRGGPPGLPAATSTSRPFCRCRRSVQRPESG